MRIFRLAWRNLWRNTRRTAVTIAAMAFGLWVMVLYSGLVSGYLLGMGKDLLDFEVGDVQVFVQGYDDDPSVYARIEDPAPLVATLEAEGYRVSPQLLAGGLAAAGEASAGVMFRGIDVERERGVLRTSERVHEGSWLDPADPTGVVLGVRLARTLGVHAGDEVIVLSQAADGSMANELFTVRGVLASVGDSADRATVFLVDDTFRAMFSVPEGVHQMVVRVPDGVTLDEGVARIEALDSTVDARTWRQVMPTIATMLDGTEALIYYVFFIAYIAIGILILNAMLMAVFERIREFGVMKAIGTGPGTVFALLMVEALIETVIAVVIGFALAVPVAIYLQEVGVGVGALSGMSMMGMTMPPVWHGAYDVGTFVGPLITLCVIVGLAALYPAVKAARIRPIDAMRYH